MFKQGVIEMNKKTHVRSDLTKLKKNQRAGEFAAELFYKYAFNENGDSRTMSYEEELKMFREIPIYIAQEEAKFQAEQN